MYEQFFGLSENPFSLTPDPRFIFASKSHDEALAHLKYWLEHREGFALITGEVGTGKTTALFRLIDGLERRYEIAFLTNSTLSPVDLLEEICRKFGIDVEPGTSKPSLLQKLEGYLRRQVERGNGSLLIIDEAQNFEQPLLEEVRLLSNIAKPGGPPMLQIALIGQPELERKLGLPDLRQLRQRIGVHYRIEPLTADETLRYVHHRVTVAGGYPRVLFPQESLDILHDRTHGLPREINQVASQALLGAYVEDSTTVRPEHVRGAIAEMNFTSVLDREGAAAPPRPTPAAPPARPTVVEVVPRPVRLEPPIEPRRESSAVRAESEPMPGPSPMPAPPAPIASAPTAAAASPPHSSPGLTRIPPTGGRGRRPDFGALPPLSAPPELPTLAGEKRAGWARFGLILGTIAILAVAGVLIFMPNRPPRDELADLESEKTIPTQPRTGPGTGPVGSVPSATQSASEAGTSASNGAKPNPALVPNAIPATDPAAVVPPVTHPAPPPAPSPVVVPDAGRPTGYRLQVASLRDSNLAVRLGTELSQRTNLPYEVVRDRKADGIAWFAINLGSFPTSDAARAAIQDLSGQYAEFTDAIVRSPRPR